MNNCVRGVNKSTRYFNSCAAHYSYNICAAFWHARAKGLETKRQKHLVVNQIWSTGGQRQKMIDSMSTIYHFRSTSGKTFHQTNFEIFVLFHQFRFRI